MSETLRQYVYFSTAAVPQDAATIAAILDVSRAWNARDGVSGLLVAGGNRYLQVVEGSSDAIGALIDRLRRDDRHIGMTALVDRDVTARDFADWSMASFDAPGLDNFATFGELVAQMRRQVSDERLLERLDRFERQFAQAPVSRSAEAWTVATPWPSPERRS